MKIEQIGERKIIRLHELINMFFFDYFKIPPKSSKVYIMLIIGREAKCFFNQKARVKIF